MARDKDSHSARQGLLDDNATPAKMSSHSDALAGAQSSGDSDEDRIPTRFDHGIRGFRRAAYHFYQRDITELTEAEFVSLMAMPVAPKKYHLAKYPEKNGVRSQRILRMVNGQYQPKGLFDIYYNKQ